MDIKEAAQLVKQGVLVRRERWSQDRYLGEDEYGVYIRISGGNNILLIYYVLSVDDLLADDWEIYLIKRVGRLSLRPLPTTRG